MRRLNNIICAIVVCFFAIQIATAQEISKSDFHFVYIDHEIDTPVNQLCKKLKELCNDALETGDPLILYLSTGLADDDYCLLSYTNLPDESGKERDTEEAFNSIIAALQNANSHNVEPRHDVLNILNLFETFNFQDEDRNILYNSVTMDFYIGNRFWRLGYNEKVIAHLYASLGISDMPKNKFSFNVFRPKADRFSINEGNAFGNNNIQGINDKVRIQEY